MVLVMALVKGVFFFVCLVELVYSLVSNSCPGRNAIAPCTCEKMQRDGFAMYCNNVYSDVDIDRVLQATRGYKVADFVLSRSHLRFFKEDSFIGTEIQRIYINQTSLLALTDTQQAFAGLEDQLQGLYVMDCSFVSHWNFNHMKYLHNMTTLSIKNSDLIYLSEAFQKISPKTLRKIDLSNNGITASVENVFAGFTRATHLVLGRNELEHFHRDIFPKPATFLQSLDLSYNMVKNLPADIFTDMPALRFLDLSGNRFHYLNEQVFGGVWGQLLQLRFIDVPLLCDCRLIWTTKAVKKPQRVVSECAEPSHVKGLSITDLKAKDLWCY